MKLIALTSNTMRLDGGSMYGHVPKTLWEKWTPADELNRIPLACRTLLLQTDEGRTILFDVGVGDFFDPKHKERYGIEGDSELLKSLANLGIAEEDVDTIILSHLHFDHAGGLLSSFDQGPLRLRFSNARYYLSHEHWNRAQHPHVRERVSFIPILTSLLKSSKRLSLIEEKTHPELDFGVTFELSHGHTPGLLLSTLETSSGPLVYASDLVPGLPWLHLPVTMGYDRYPELIVDEKERLLKELLEKKGRILFTHDLNTPCARVCRDSQGRFFGEAASLH